jgi:hypothetical protein
VTRNTKGPTVSSFIDISKVYEIHETVEIARTLVDSALTTVSRDADKSTRANANENKS